MSSASRVVLITGPEPLIIEETLDAIRANHKDAERLRFGAGEKIDWPLLEGINREIPMLASERLVEVRLDGAKMDKKAVDCLTSILDNPSPDCVFILVKGALTKAETNSAWYKAIAAKGAIKSHKKIEGDAFTKWLRGQFKQAKLEVDLEAEVLLSHQLEGNLLAAAQQIELLALTAKDGRVSLSDVENSIVESTQFREFALNDAILAGDVNRALRVVRQMQVDGISPVQINSTITRELSAAFDVARAHNNSERLNIVKKRVRLWPRRQQQFVSLAQRLGRDSIDECLRRAARIDSGIKGRLAGQSFAVWDELTQLVCVACDEKVVLHPESPLNLVN